MKKQAKNAFERVIQIENIQFLRQITGGCHHDPVTGNWTSCKKKAGHGYEVTDKRGKHVGWVNSYPGNL